MSVQYQFDERINLHVEGRISKEDADRQERTAREILSRLEDQPGVILADEVGMGKTFVGLAIAVSIALNDKKRRPVVVMVPPSLRNKWPNDFELFKEKCIREDLRSRIRYGRANRAVEFLKLIDDPIDRRNNIIFVTHGAMSRGLRDNWVRLALIHQAIKHRRNAPKTRKNMSKFMSRLLDMRWVEKKGKEIWEELLREPPSEWLDILHRWGIDPEGDDDPGTDDDPVPESVCRILCALDTDDLYRIIQKMPVHESKHIKKHLTDTRKAINKCARSLWKKCVRALDLDLPLLVLDEAHHLKNPYTRLASLFHIPEAREDVEEIVKGPLGGAFERMLFLTATPFQLGHAELCSVLDRFTGISWQGCSAPSYDLEGFKQKLSDLRAALDSAQEVAVTLDKLWGNLGKNDLSIGDKKYEDVLSWWHDLNKNAELTTSARHVMDSYESVKYRMNEAEMLLRPWVIRHIKQKHLPKPNEDTPRRERYCGRSILNEEAMQCLLGLDIPEAAILPFLLAARATALTPDSRPVFAEGLASSYEAFLHTRRLREERNKKEQSVDGDDEAADYIEITDPQRWYLDKLEECIPKESDKGVVTHPKMSATVQKVVDSWRSGEKVTVFCHYVATGKVLRQKISNAIELEIRRLGAKKLKCKQSEVFDELDRFGKRFFDVESPIRKACDDAVGEILSKYSQLDDFREKLIDIVRRNVRTPTFLVRYFPLGRDRLDEASMRAALNRNDASGMTLHELIAKFFDLLVNRCSDYERHQYIDALDRIQTGTHYGVDAAQSYADDELQGDEPAILLPNVRLVNGSTAQDTRQRLMLTFNTPFYPEVLIASSVMAEGVDLHLNCRYIIHHDLCWNPSTLEQRTGRVDRIGAKIEVCGKPLKVYLPYLAETQDEKMFRVVMDRERWFKVVMGEKYNMDARTTDRMADRIPFPVEAAEELSFNLEI